MLHVEEKRRVVLWLGQGVGKVGVPNVGIYEPARPKENLDNRAW
jgi:hypothetical protein